MARMHAISTTSQPALLPLQLLLLQPQLTVQTRLGTNTDATSSSPHAWMRALLTPWTGECDRPALMPITPQVSTAPKPCVEKQEPNTASILSSRIMHDSSRHRLAMAMELSPEKPYPASASSTRVM